MMDHSDTLFCNARGFNQSNVAIIFKLAIIGHVQCLNIFKKRIGGVMISVLASSAVDRGFESLSSQTKDYEIGMCLFFVKHTALRSMTDV
jgi:predicted oxidoreductase